MHTYCVDTSCTNTLAFNLGHVCFISVSAYSIAHQFVLLLHQMVYNYSNSFPTEANHSLCANRKDTHTHKHTLVIKHLLESTPCLINFQFNLCLKVQRFNFPCYQKWNSVRNIKHTVGTNHSLLNTKTRIPAQKYLIHKYINIQTILSVSYFSGYNNTCIFQTALQRKFRISYPCAPGG